MTNPSTTVPTGASGAQTRAPRTATPLVAICANGAGALLDHVPDVVIHAPSGPIQIPKYRVPTTGEIELLCRVANLVRVGSDFTTTLTDAEVIAALDELRPPWSEEPAHVVNVTALPMKTPGSAVATRVDTAVLASFLDDVGKRAVADKVEDLQVLLGRARGGALRDISTVQGLVADLDYPVKDPAREHLLRGAPAPNVVYATEHGGARALYVFAEPFAPSYERLAQRRAELFHALNVAYPRLDGATLRIEQRQYFPTFIRTTKGPPRVVERSAIGISSVPLDLEGYTPSLPAATLAALGVGTGGLGDAERDEIVAFLQGIGVVLPGTGSARSSRCPIKQHTSRKFYVGRSARGAISGRCFGGHGGAGQKVWNEHALLRLARGGDP